MKRVKICNCGGVLTATKYFQVFEGEECSELIERIKKDKVKKLFIHQCDRCPKIKIYKQ